MTCFDVSAGLQHLVDAYQELAGLSCLHVIFSFHYIIYAACMCTCKSMKKLADEVREKIHKKVEF